MGVEAAPSAGGMLMVQIVVLGVLIVAVLYAILAVTAALGLTSFSMFERFRKRREEPEDGGIDDLLSSDPRMHPGACTSSCAAGCDVVG